VILEYLAIQLQAQEQPTDSFWTSAKIFGATFVVCAFLAILIAV